MFLSRLVRIALVGSIFITTYLPITINPRIFERNPRDAVSYIVEDSVASAIDY